jgi:hypothetical protein
MNEGNDRLSELQKLRDVQNSDEYRRLETWAAELLAKADSTISQAEKLLLEKIGVRFHLTVSLGGSFILNRVNENGEEVE